MAFGKFCQNFGMVTDNWRDPAPSVTIGVARNPSKVPSPVRMRKPRNEQGTAPSRFTCVVERQFSPPLESWYNSKSPVARSNGAPIAGEQWISDAVPVRQRERHRDVTEQDRAGVAELPTAAGVLGTPGIAERHLEEHGCGASGEMHPYQASDPLVAP